jgi:hypothetical protein
MAKPATRLIKMAQRNAVVGFKQSPLWRAALLSLLGKLIRTAAFCKALRGNLLQQEYRPFRASHFWQGQIAANREPARAGNENGREKTNERQVEFEARRLTQKESIFPVHQSNRAEHDSNQRGRGEAAQEAHDQAETAKELSNRHKIPNGSHKVHDASQTRAIERAEQLLGTVSHEREP